MHNKLKGLIDKLRKDGQVFFLDSQSADHPSSCKSYLAALPDASIEVYGNSVNIRDSSGLNEKIECNPWEALKRFRKNYPGWHFGWLGYDLKNHIEKLTSTNPDQVHVPDLYFIRPGKLFEIDPKTEGIRKVLTGDNGTEYQNDYSDTYFEFSDLTSSISKSDYLESINKAKRQIREGEFYEINLSHQLCASYKGDPLELYEMMRQVGPVPFGAYVEREDFTICCASPERFLNKRGKILSSEPIKGTIRRGNNLSEDKELKNLLIKSDKNKAENLMIVDLVRNDLSRISKPGTVCVNKLYELQTFNTLHQMVSTVTSEVEDKTDSVDVIKACFPMGSMTGAPKIKSMEHIESLESYKRGIYSGSIGYFTPDNDFDFNVVIRTGIVKNSRLYYSIGGAITSDSNPLEEWDETWIKARALTEIRAIGYKF